MCVIIACQSNKPTQDIIEAAHYENSDGAGIAYFKDGKAEYKKWLYPFELENKIKELELPFIIHFRESSIGMGKQPVLCHPFEISVNSPLKLEGATDKLLIHNGTLFEYKSFLKKFNIELKDDELISDTRAIAMIMGKFYEDEKHIRLLTHICNTYLNQRFVLVDGVEKKFKMFGDFIHENGCWYSNMKWKKNLKPIVNYNRFNDTSSCIPTVKPVIDLDLSSNADEEIDANIPQVSPLYLQMNKYDRAKYLAKVKKQDKLNGAATVKTGKICCFCECDISADRLNRLRVLGYLDDELSCIKCAELLHYTLPFSQEFKRLLGGQVVT